MKTKLYKIVLVMFVTIVSLVGFASSASAHGYVTAPGSRAYLGSTKYTNDTGLPPLNKNIGAAMYEPQSIEALKGTFIDGKIASAGLERFSALDEQTPTRWYKTDISTGNLKVKWHLTARHSTAGWDYYMTKSTWKPDQPLTINDFEKIKSINSGGVVPPSDVEQNINIPSDRHGYNIILAVWNIADTSNAFYQAIDVNVK